MLRVLVVYRRVVSIDLFLEHLLVPYKFSELVTACVGDFRSNIDLNELLHDKHSSLDDSLSFSVSHS